MRRLVLLAGLLAALAGASPAAAEIVTSQDHAGRTLTFDVRAPGVDVEWYAALLRDAAHGDEIQEVTVRIVSADALRDQCGGGAEGCYRHGSEARITVPAGSSRALAHTLLHEYAHHVDRYRGVAAASREPNGSASWWNARRLTRRLDAGEVSYTYSRGWERSIGELFAEDYAQLHLETPFRIEWLDPPNAAVRAALRKDLENVPAAPLPAERKPPVIVTRRGTLRGAATTVFPFELLGPGRRVTFSAEIGPATARVRIELRCSDGRRAVLVLDGARPAGKLDRKGLGPARCSITMRNTGPVAASYFARLRLAIEGSSA